MSREVRLTHLFVELADTLVDDFDVVDLFTKLVEACVEILEIDAAGLMLADQREGLRLVASAPLEPMNTLQMFELQADEGPCLDSYRGGQQVVNVAVADAFSRWPLFSATAMELGFVRTHALPLRLRGQVLGAVNLASARDVVLSQDDVTIGQALADIAAIALLQQRAIRDQTLLGEQLQNALNTRVLIEQAKGVLAERLGVDVNQSFALLRRHARSKGRPLHAVAQAVVDGSLDTATLHA